ncbi:DUF2958 domain-containing protein [Sphingomonas sp. Leaf25]|uniref:DUF2958 domain-containing protein n=1 Tax=Sphingomonas sp. Leaf25 TaxID=1735692 RepID=UPI0009E93EBD|nr:DUF2958 domain-containing protein [Sphingomonas sp. Leaf25]
MKDYFSDEELALLVENGRRSAAEPDFDPVPVARLFVPDGAASWLLTEIDPSDLDLAYGLCDAGIGLPEEGYFRLTALARPTGVLGAAAERDLRWRAPPGLTLSTFARLAAAAGRIIV